MGRGRRGRRGGSGGSFEENGRDSSFTYSGSPVGKGSRGRSRGRYQNAWKEESGNSYGRRDGSSGSWRERQNLDETRSLQGKQHNGGRSGHPTDSFGVMGGADNLTCSDSNSPRKLVSEEVPLATMEDIRFEAGKDSRVIHAEPEIISPMSCATNGVAVCPSEPDLKYGFEYRNEIMSSEINERVALESRSVPSCRRVRSLSQTMVLPDDTRTIDDARLSMKYSSVGIAEEEKEELYSGEDIPIRTVHNDNFKHHRLSKLSIHTNNDEFFFVGGHPPSDGRTSLRSRGSVSRQSMMHSSDFLPGTNEDWLAEGLRAVEVREPTEGNACEERNADSVADNEVYEDNYNQCSYQQTVPTLLVNGKTLSGSSLYETAPDQVKSPMRGGAVFEDMVTKDRPVSGSSSSNNLEYESADENTQRCGSTASVHSSHPLLYDGSHTNDTGLCASTAYMGQDQLVVTSKSIYSNHESGDKSVRVATVLSSGGLQTSNACNLDQPPISKSRQNLQTGEYAVDNAGVAAASGSLRVSSTNLGHEHLTASRQSMQSCAHEDDGYLKTAVAPDLYSSRRSLRFSTANLEQDQLAASRQSLYSNHESGDNSVRVATVVSSGGLQTSNACNLDQPPISKSRQNLQTGDYAVDNAGVATASGSLRVSSTNLGHEHLTASRQSMQSCAHEDDGYLKTAVAPDLYSSRRSLRFSTANLEQDQLAASRQSLYSNHESGDNSVRVATVVSSGGLQTSNACNLDQPPISKSRQNLQTGNYAVDNAGVATASGSLRVSSTNLGHEHLTASRQSMQSCAHEDDGYLKTAVAPDLYSSRRSLSVSTANLERDQLAASRQSLYSNHESGDNSVRVATVVSSGGLQTSNACNLDQPPISKSRQNLQTGNYAVDNAGVATASGSLRVSSTNLGHEHLTASRQSMQSCAHEDDGYLKTAVAPDLYSSRRSLRVSTANLEQDQLAASRQSLYSNHESGDNSVRVATVVSSGGLQTSNACNLDQPPISKSRQNLQTGDYAVDNAGVATASGSLRVSSTNLGHEHLTASRQSMQSCAHEDDGYLKTAVAPDLYSSRRSLRVSTANLEQDQLAASRQSLYSNHESGDNSVRVATVVSSGGLQTSNACNLDQPPISKSRQDLQTGNYAVDNAGVATASGSLRVSSTNLGHEHLTASRQSMQSCAHEDDGYLKTAVAPDLYSSRRSLRVSTANLEQDQLVASRQSLYSNHESGDNSVRVATVVSSGGLQTSNASNLDQPPISKSRQDLQTGNYAVDNAGVATASGSLRVSSTNLGHEHLTASRQSMQSCAHEDDGYLKTAVAPDLCSSRRSLRVSTANLEQDQLAASRQSLYSNHESGDNSVRVATVVSSGGLQTSNACNLDQPPISKSRQDLQTGNYAVDNAGVATASGSLRVSSTNLGHEHLTASRQSMQSCAHEDDGYLKTAVAPDLYSSRRSLRVSTANLEQDQLAASRQSLYSNHESGDNSVRVATVVSSGGLQTSNACNLDQPPISKSRQDLQTGDYAVDNAGVATASGSLRVSSTNLGHEHLTASRQSMQSCAHEDDGYLKTAVAPDLYSSRRSLRVSTANLEQDQLAASRQSLYSNHESGDNSVRVATVVSSGGLQTSNACNLDQPPISKSRQDLQTGDYAVDNAGVATASGSLRVSSTNLGHEHLTASRQSMQSCAHEDDGYLKTAVAPDLYSSRRSLRVSTANLEQDQLAASRQSLYSNHESGDNSVRVATVVSSGGLQTSNACNLDQPPISKSRQDLQTGDYAVDNAGVATASGSLRVSSTNLGHEHLTASRQSMQSCAHEDDGYLKTAVALDVYSSQRSLRVSTANLEQDQLAASCQSLYSNHESGDNSVRVATVVSSEGLQSSNACDLDQSPISEARQNLQTGDHAVDNAGVPTASGSLRVSSTNLGHEHLIASRQSTRLSTSSGVGGTDSLKKPEAIDNSEDQMLSTSRFSVARELIDDLHPNRVDGSSFMMQKDDIEKQPRRISMASTSPISRASSKCSVKVETPTPSVRSSLQSIKTAVSRSSSQNSVHGFATGNGALWFHFSDSDRRRSLSSNNRLNRQSSAGSPNKTRLETTSAAPKKPPRSRSSSSTRQTGVHFSSIPQLLSHPDDRFNVIDSGEPFRPTSEHKLTPQATDTKSRLHVSSTVEGDNVQSSHKTIIDLDTQLLTIPVHSGADSKTTSEMEPPSRTPSLRSIDIVPPALVVTDALTPKRPPSCLNEPNNNDVTPASLNRTIFSRHTFQQRRFKEPLCAEIGVQTGETIRLRQGMVFGQATLGGDDSAAKERLAPFGQKNSNTSFERFANNSFEKRGHPAPAVLTAMLQQRQNLVFDEGNSGLRRPAEDPVLERQRASVEDDAGRSEMLNERQERRRSFFDNQCHSYETRTHQEWRSSTRSQWEDGKVVSHAADECLLDSRSVSLQTVCRHCLNRESTYLQQGSPPWKQTIVSSSVMLRRRVGGMRSDESQQQVEKMQCSHMTDQVFEEPEMYAERGENRYKYSSSQSCAIEQKDNVRRGADSLLPQMGASSMGKSSGDALNKTTGSNVITKEAVQQLRQTVVSESRTPSTPKGSRIREVIELPPPIDIKDFSIADGVIRESITPRDNSLIGTPTTRISMNMKSPESPWSPSRGWGRCKLSESKGDGSPYKWQVLDIDVHRVPKEPDARSNDSRASHCGSTVRRHVPRGRIRDLARLFDGMSQEAKRQSEMLRGKSLPPPKHRSAFFRTRSLRRPHDFESRFSKDSAAEIRKTAGRNMEDSQAVNVSGKDHVLVDVPISLRATEDVAGYSRTASANKHLAPTQTNGFPSVPDAAGEPQYDVIQVQPQKLGQEVTDRDDAASTDSRVDLRRTSTPVGAHAAGDLAVAFGRLPPITFTENSVTYQSNCVESCRNVVPQTLEPTNLVGEERIRREENVSCSRSSPEPHYAEPGIMKSAPPQRLSVIHPNTGHGCCVQYRHSQFDQHPYPTKTEFADEPVYAKVHRVSVNQPNLQPPPSRQRPQNPCAVSTVETAGRSRNVEEENVNGEIDKMFEFVEEHDGLSTVGRGTESKRSSAVLKHSDNGAGPRNGGSQPQVLPSQPITSHVGLESKPNQDHREHPLKYSISGYRDMQRQRIQRLSSEIPPRFSPLTAPTAGIGVSTYKSREGTIGEKVSTISRYSLTNAQQPSALATSTPLESPMGTGLPQVATGAPNLDDSFVSTITTASHLQDAHEEYKRQIADCASPKKSGFKRRHSKVYTCVHNAIQKLNHQIRIQEEQVEMTLKVLALARKKQKAMQELSAQRTLLLARERLELLRCEVNRISALAAVRNPPPPVSRELRGSMTISNITVLLNRNFSQRQYDHDASYALLILLKCGAEVEATGPVSLLAHAYQQPRVRQLTFAEHIQFSNLPVDFNVILEVYAMKLLPSKPLDQSCATNIANKCRNLLNPALAHHPNRISDDLHSSEFVRCGYIILNRDTVGVNKFYLDEAEYPLEGIIEVHARCTTLPPAIEVDNRGFLTMYQTVGGMASWERFWAVLRRGMVYFWRYPDEESMDKRPLAFMDLSKCTNEVVMACSVDQCPRQHSFSIDMLVSTTPSMMEKKRVLLSADSDELLHAWLQALNETLSVLRG